MEGFIIRVTGYHGEPKQVGSIPYRSGLSHERPIPHDEVVNQVDGRVVLDLNATANESTYDIDCLIEDFQDEYRCKVNYENGGTQEHGVRVYEFDVFEPSWPKPGSTEDVIDDLLVRLVDWTHGYPTGR